MPQYTEDLYRIREGVAPHNHRLPDGRQVTLGPGDVFRPGVRELRAIRDKLERAPTQAQPTYGPTVNTEEPDEGQETGPEDTETDQTPADTDSESEGQEEATETSEEEQEEEGEEEVAGSIEPEEEGEESSNLTSDDFASPVAYNLWKDADQPDLAGVERTGHNGTTFSVNDVRDFIAEQE